MTEAQDSLVTEQVKHALDLFKADLDAIRATEAHHNEMTNLRLTNAEHTIVDHEERIRSAHDGVTQFKLFAGLASGGSSILAVISLIKAFFGGG